MSMFLRRMGPLAGLLALAAVLLTACGDGRGPAAMQGQIDLRNWDFKRQGIVELDGQWLLQPQRFDDPAKPASDAQPVAVPGSWNGAQGNAGSIGPYSHATYRLRIQCNSADNLALSLPFQHSAVRWFVNGVEFAQQGKPGVTQAQSEPSVQQQIVQLPAAQCPLDITAHASNYELRRGGLMRSVELGDARAMLERRELALVRDVGVMGGLAVMGVLPLLFFLGRRRDTAPLYFGLFCLVFALGMGLSGTRVLQPLFSPIGWDGYLRVLFVCWCSNNVLYALFLRSLYPSDFDTRVIRVMVAWTVLACAVVLVAPANIYLQMLPLIVVAAALILVYLVWRLGALWRRGRRLAGLLLAGLLLFAASVVFDTMNFSHLSRLTLVPYGVILFVSAPAFFMARRFSRALSVEERVAIEQRERADLLVRSTKAGVLDWDAISRRTTYSDRYREMLGFAVGPDAPEPPGFNDVLHPDDRERVLADFRKQLADHSVKSGVRTADPIEYRLRRADGGFLWAHAEGIFVCDARGRTLRFITSVIDITQVKTHEREMQEQQEALRTQIELNRTEQRRLDLVVRAARVGIVDWDGRTHETYYSARFREIRGYAPDADTSGWPDYFKVMIHPDDRERITKRWTKFIIGKGPEGPFGEFYAPDYYRLVKADGEYAWVEVTGIAVRDETGFVLRWIAAIIDITERRAQQELLEKQNEALKENVRLREEVERIGRHDIKTPLNSIVAVPRLLREERKLGPEADELLGIVERAGYRILSMVNLSLDLYKMEQGNYIFRPDAVDLADLVGKVIADVRMHAASKDVRLQVKLDGAPYAWAEELLCYSLLANLLKNAVEASPAGGVVSIVAEAGAEETLVIHLHNRGVVPESIRGSFFQKYATLGKASGTGLGTYSARLMALVQDGDITMRTSEEEGTTLSVTLRAAPAGVVPATVRHAAERDDSDPAEVSSLRPMDVLLVDDDEYNLLIVRRFLPTPPFTVSTAINGRVALAAAEVSWPDVIFMDLDMPVMGGLEAVQELRAMERRNIHARCTMVALSSHEDDDTREAALAAGFDRYLTKPVTREMIHETLLELEMVIGGPETPVMPSLASVKLPVAATAASMNDPIIVEPDIEPVLAEFIASRRILLLAMLTAVDAGDRGEVRRIAHQLAGSFGLYGFIWASDQCRWVEKNFSDVAPRRIAELVSLLTQHLDEADVRFIGQP